MGNSLNLNWDFAFSEIYQRGRSSEENLLIGIIYRAVQDYLGVDTEDAKFDYQRTRNRDRAEAETFIFYDGSEPWSIGWICAWLFDEPSVFLTQLRVAIKAAQKEDVKTLGIHYIQYRNLAKIS